MSLSQFTVFNEFLIFYSLNSVSFHVRTTLNIPETFNTQNQASLCLQAVHTFESLSILSFSPHAPLPHAKAPSRCFKLAALVKFLNVLHVTVTFAHFPFSCAPCWTQILPMGSTFLLFQLIDYLPLISIAFV